MRTKPSAKSSLISKVTLGVPDAELADSAFALAKAQVAGVALAREWGNRPANHATPTMLAEAARLVREAGFEIVNRTILIDQSTILANNLSFFF